MKMLPLSSGRDSDTFVNFYTVHVITLQRTVMFTANHYGTIRSQNVKASLLNKAVWAWNPEGGTQHATNTIITKQCQFVDLIVCVYLCQLQTHFTFLLSLHHFRKCSNWKGNFGHYIYIISLRLAVNLCQPAMQLMWVSLDTTGFKLHCMLLG
jgi:hypothetical protein